MRNISQHFLDFSNKVNYFVCLNTNGKISHAETIKLIFSALKDLENRVSTK